MERETILRTLREAGNMDRAATKLGASRRTLQLHMRRVGLPPGKAGRPRTDLPFGVTPKTMLNTGLVMLGVGAAIVIGLRLWKRKDKQTVIGEGFDLLGAQ